MSDETIKNHADFIWSVADLLRGVYKQSEYGRVILPLTVLRRLDCVLEPTKDKVLERAAGLPATLENRDPVLEQAAGQTFYNTSKHTFTTLLADTDNVAGNLRNYIAGFSESARDIVAKFNFDTQIDRLTEHNLLYMVVSKFADLDLHPEVVSNLEMGYLYEELIRKFSELLNETAGEHFTPREVIRLMVNLFVDDDEQVDQTGCREDDARPCLRHRWHALSRRRAPPPQVLIPGPGSGAREGMVIVPQSVLALWFSS